MDKAGTRNVIVSGVVYAQNQTDDKFYGYRLPGLTHKLPTNADLSNLRHSIIKCNEKDYSFCDFGEAVDESKTNTLARAGVSVASTETAPVQAIIASNDTWPVSDQDGLTLTVTIDGDLVDTITFDSTFPTTDEAQRQHIADLLNEIDGVVSSSDNTVFNELITQTVDGGSNKTIAFGGTNTIVWGTPTAGTGAPTDVNGVFYLIDDSTSQYHNHVAHYTIDGWRYYKLKEGQSVTDQERYSRKTKQSTEINELVEFQLHGETETSSATSDDTILRLNDPDDTTPIYYQIADLDTDNQNDWLFVTVEVVAVRDNVPGPSPTSPGKDGAVGFWKEELILSETVPGPTTLTQIDEQISNVSGISFTDPTIEIDSSGYVHVKTEHTQTETDTTTIKWRCRIYGHRIFGDWYYFSPA